MALHEMNDSTSNSAGKSPLRKLGRGLGALLGAPVPVTVPPPTAISDQSKTPNQPVATSVASPSLNGIDLTLGVPRGTDAPAAVVEYKPAAHISARNPRQPAPAVPSTSPSEGELRLLRVELIHPNQRQPRTSFDEGGLKSLAESIRSAGLMQPIVVRPSKNGTFELVAGERRWRASKLLGLAEIPALVRELSDQSSAELALIENVHREDLHAMERAFALRKLAEEFALTHASVADRVGLDRASVTNLLRLTELDAGVASMVRSGALSQGHAKALLSVINIDARVALAKSSVSAGWSVRELERRVKAALEAPNSSNPRSAAPKIAHVSDLERQLSSKLGTKVQLQLGRKKGSGRLIVDFFTLDQFDGLLARLGVSQLES